MPNPPIISIVDDDDVVRLSMDSLIRSMGYTANAYSSAEAFLASDSLATSACLISDIQMPGLSGWQLIEEVRSRANCYPVIFVTASVGELSQLKARALGAAGYFKKPFNGAELMSRVQEVMVRTPRLSPSTDDQ